MYKNGFNGLPLFTPAPLCWCTETVQKCMALTNKYKYGAFFNVSMF